jgi:hypothetical protein
LRPVQFGTELEPGIQAGNSTVQEVGRFLTGRFQTEQVRESNLAALAALNDLEKLTKRESITYRKHQFVYSNTQSGIRPASAQEGQIEIDDKGAEAPL